METDRLRGSVISGTPAPRRGLNELEFQAWLTATHHVNAVDLAAGERTLYVHKFEQAAREAVISGAGFTPPEVVCQETPIDVDATIQRMRDEAVLAIETESFIQQERNRIAEEIRAGIR